MSTYARSFVTQICSCSGLTSHSTGPAQKAAQAGEFKCSPLASLGENAALSSSYLVPLAPLRENQALETDALRALLSAALDANNNDSKKL